MRHPSRSTLFFVLLAAVVAIPAAGAQQRLRKLIEQRRELAAAAPLPAGTRIERDVAYGPDARQRYDVYLPGNRKPGAPILVMVHGGGWRTGDKGNAGVVGNKAAHWLGKGFVFVSVNNRLLPDAGPVQQAGDVATALASIQRHAGGWGADPARLVLMGHSAGAHLVALLGASPSMLEKVGASPPRGVVALDSAAMDVPQMMEKPLLPGIYDAAFGSDPGVWRSASPFHQLSRGAVPMLVVCSSRRTDACPQGRALAAKAAAFGVPIEVLPQDLTHAAINHDLGADAAYTRAVESWIDRRVR